MSGIFSVDNCIMCRIGVVAKIGLINASFVVDIPFSVTGENIHLIDKKLVNIDIYKVEDSI